MKEIIFSTSLIIFGIAIGMLIMYIKNGRK